MEFAVDVVLVTYFPDRERLQDCLKSVAGQVRTIVLVSNSPEDFSDLAVPVVHIALGENKGIGKAQNEGIVYSLRNGADFVLISDQDTVYPEGFVLRLLEDMVVLRQTDDKIAAVGPVFRDENQGGRVHPMVRFGDKGLERFIDATQLTPVSHMIASGMLLSAESILAVGFMREEYFIDWVDTEWCWRAITKGWKLYQDPTLQISHELGQGTKDYQYFSVTKHSYVREYFKLRNGILLWLSSGDIALPVRGYLAAFLAKNVLVNLLRGFRKPIHIEVVFRSIFDGFRGKTGPCKF